jgi:hypothetical protein
MMVGRPLLDHGGGGGGTVRAGRKTFIVHERSKLTAVE